MAVRLREQYRKAVVPKLREQFGYKNVHQVPHLDKVVINIGLGEATQNPKLLEKAAEELAALSGQKPVLCRAKKSIAAFRLRENQAIACRVTLRGDRMWEFLDRLMNIALPRVRDFKGVSPKSFDGRGNYNLGIKDHSIFPEINYDKIERMTGMNITMCIASKSDEESRALLGELGMPFRK